MKKEKTNKNPYLIGEEKINNVRCKMSDIKPQNKDPLKKGVFKHLSNLMEKGKISYKGNTNEIKLRGNMAFCF